jgi:hypothetical protein
MRRWILSFVGALLLAGPVVLRQIAPCGMLDVIGCRSVQDGLPTWLRVSTSAGAYLIEYGPMLAGLLLIYYANRRQI